MFYFHSFIHSCPVFPAPVIKETIFSPLHILASSVKDKVPIGVLSEGKAAKIQKERARRRNPVPLDSACPSAAVAKTVTGTAGQGTRGLPGFGAAESKSGTTLSVLQVFHQKLVPVPLSIPTSSMTGPTGPRQREPVCENGTVPWAGRWGTWAQASIPPPAGFLGPAVLVQEARESDQRSVSPLLHPEVMCSLGEEIGSLGWACTRCYI